MKSGRVWVTGVLVFAVCVMTSCSEERPTTYGLLERDALRIKLDSARNRIWLLGLDGVRVYDTEKKRLARKVLLPNWNVARLACMPDMALDRTGSAYISSNVQSRLWRIDAETLQVDELEISLRGREHWDMGFGALAFAADGNLFALTSMGRWLWRVDIAQGSADLVDPKTSLITVCGLTTPIVERL